MMNHERLLWFCSAPQLLVGCWKRPLAFHAVERHVGRTLVNKGDDEKWGKGGKELRSPAQSPDRKLYSDLTVPFPRPPLCPPVSSTSKRLRWVIWLLLSWGDFTPPPRQFTPDTGEFKPATTWPPPNDGDTFPFPVVERPHRLGPKRRMREQTFLSQSIKTTHQSSMSHYLLASTPNGQRGLTPGSSHQPSSSLQTSRRQFSSIPLTILSHSYEPLKTVSFKNTTTIGSCRNPGGMLSAYMRWIRSAAAAKVTATTMMTQWSSSYDYGSGQRGPNPLRAVYDDDDGTTCQRVLITNAAESQIRTEGRDRWNERRVWGTPTVRLPLAADACTSTPPPNVVERWRIDWMPGDSLLDGGINFWKIKALTNHHPFSSASVVVDDVGMTLFGTANTTTTERPNVVMCGVGATLAGILTPPHTITTDSNTNTCRSKERHQRRPAPIQKQGKSERRVTIFEVCQSVNYILVACYLNLKLEALSPQGDEVARSEVVRRYAGNSTPNERW
ncbi:hypothetical protein BDN72DRAFT_864130 [Pluteus cervinus]|uniref:Uncharacterized protein n=1 Tax=Pluteus cervinus TaxID=181527 RepID=A0ACD3A5R6_9AGAR|nr:hypothetical protein BDN72DRAFT_864130 [Pluteus cervinus]